MNWGIPTEKIGGFLVSALQLMGKSFVYRLFG
jgi:hypothetical protein